ncbi:MAG: hypothetical protein KKB51_07025 [Candidatus Riflebacteria bacterium]|nr:hypothetical protein [Candidatus Riflebacteria bacterium]
MIDQLKLIEKLLKIQALHEQATTQGEKNAALAAMTRITEQLKNVKPQPQVEELKFSTNNPWSRQLLIALLRKHKIEPYRKPRQKGSTVMARMTPEYCDKVFWPEFLALDKELIGFINRATEEIIKKAVNPDLSEPGEQL